ncbi:MAG: two-component system, NarL family, sensor histidine kinase DesK [Solirubrobacteraceae bacterium]|nr:two-component system, NarL family, sensor histidine kinase DesK [Solirubrobacteraceae bacterium]
MPGARPVTRADWRRKRIAINVSFLWILFPVSDLLGSHPGSPRAAAVLAAVALFVVAYNVLPRRHGPPSHDWRMSLTLALLALLAIALTVADRGSWSILFIFTAIGGAMRLPRRAGALWIVLCTALSAATLVAVHGDAAATISISASTLGIGFMMFAFRRLMQLNGELVDAREEVARLAVSEERARFARDLHDLLGHSLSVIAVKAELAERLLERDPVQAAEHVADIRTVARDALGEVRDAVSGYRQPTLVSELEGARMALEAAGIEAELEAADVELPAEVEAVLAWAVREGTTNIVRHSGARSCRIAVVGGPEAVSAEVVDDGDALGPAGTGHGLAGLRERAAGVAGSVEAGPSPGGGFRLCVTVPRRLVT